jgi:DNA-binding CsgD family transcriptional regulator
VSVTKRPLVGRTAELTRIGQALDAAAAGDPTFVLVLGEAGIGKTALLRTTAWLAAGRGLRTLHGTAIASGTSIPYLPLVAPLRAAVADLPAGDSAASRVRAALDGEASSDDSNLAAGAARLLEAIYEVLTAKPSLLVVDDVHWADSSTLTVLDYLAHRVNDEHLAVVAAARDDEPGGLRVPIADGRRFLQLPLARLGREAVREQITQLTGRPMPDSLAERLYDRSAGNPLWVEELLAGATGAAGDDGRRAPPSLAGLVGSRVARLSAPARLVTDALAIIGTPADISLVAAVAELDGEDAARALADAEDSGVAARRADAYALRHPLFGEVIASELAGSPRAATMHRRAAEALEELGAAAATLAGHWAAAGDRERTLSSSRAAGEQAETSGGWAEAQAHLERAADLLPASQERADVLLRAAHAAWLSGATDDALALAQRAHADSGPRFDVTLAEAQYAWDAGRRGDSTQLFILAADLVTEDSAPLTRAKARWGLGRARIGQNRPADARVEAVAAAEAAALDGSATWQCHAWVLAGMARAWEGDLRSVDDLQRGAQFAERSGDPVAIGHAYQFLGGQLFWAGRLDDARDVGLEGVRRCDRLGTARSFGTDARAIVALAQIELGAWREADAILEPAEPRAVATLCRALLAMRRGEWAAAEQALAAAAQEPAIGGRGRLGGSGVLARVEMAWLRGEADEALRQLESLPDEVGVWGVDQAARRIWWQARLGRGAGARVEHVHRAMADALNAELAAIESGTEAAWIAATDAWGALPRPYEFAITALSAAEAAFARGDRAAGRRWLESALEAASQLGALPLVARAEALGRRARITLSKGDRIHKGESASLTAREAEVLELLAEGRTNPQIAQVLFLSPKTVGIHVSRVLEKLDAHTRGEAVAIARRRGILA